MAVSDFKRYMVPGALVIGGVTAGTMLAPVALAAADDTSDSTDPAGTTAEHNDDGRRVHARRHALRHAARNLGGEVVTDTLDMTTEELREAFAEGKTLAEIAAEQGVSVDDLHAALVDAATERIDEAVAGDRIDADRAVELKAGLDDRVSEMINSTPGDRLGHHHGHRGQRGERAEALAEFLGLTTDDLRAAFSEGQTLAEVAEAQGVSEDDLVAFLLDSVEERLNQALENGRVDADDVDDKLAEAEERIEEQINAEPGERLEGLRERHRQAHGHHGFHGGHGDSDTDRDDVDADGETVESSLDV